MLNDEMKSSNKSLSVNNSLNSKKMLGGGRASNLELYRIIAMFLIVAHHYVVNSGLLTAINEQNVLQFRDYFLLVFGAWGKTGINCFVLITGYFMCTSHITKRKFCKLVGERYFYAIVFYMVFLFTGYEQSPLKSLIKVVYPLYSINQNFTTCFLLFYLLIPFLNKLIGVLDEKKHRLLLIWCVVVYVVLPSIPMASISFNYITWFCILFIIASYIRLYPMEWMNDNRIVGPLMAISIFMSAASVVVVAYFSRKLLGKSVNYFFVSDSNKIIAVLTGVTSFLFFRNLKIRNNKVINKIATSTFGVLLIHANSDTMRQWLWRDVCNVVGEYEKGGAIILHAVLCVAIIYIVCTLIDMLRIFLFQHFRKKITTL